MAPYETLSFNLMSSGKRYRRISLSATQEYCEVLIKFLRGEKYNGFEIDSVVTPVALTAVEKSIAKFYADESVVRELSQAITDQISGNSPIGRIVRGEVSQNSGWLQKEARDLLSTNLGGTISTDVGEKLAQNIDFFIHSTAGNVLVSSLSKLLATGAGKVLLAKMAVIVGHVVVSSAFQTVMVAAVKKVGVTVLVKTAVGKAIIAVLALLGISTAIPVIFIVLPIIVGLLVYEYKHLPEKLAKEVPSQVTQVLRGKFDEMNQQITEALVNGVFDEFVSKSESHLRTQSTLCTNPSRKKTLSLTAPSKQLSNKQHGVNVSSEIASTSKIRNMPARHTQPTKPLDYRASQMLLPKDKTAIEKIRHLWISSNLKVGDIAMEVGYSQPVVDSLIKQLVKSGELIPRGQ